MYCRNCGQKIEAGDKFCSSCGEKTILANESDMTETAGAVKNEAPQAKEAEKTEEPLFEPFKFDALDFEKGLAIDPTPSVPAAEEVKKEIKEEIKKPTPLTEEFDWGIHTFPGANAAKTADIDFNWSAHPDEIDLDEPKAVEEEKPAEVTLEEEPEVFTSQESKWQTADMPDVTEQETVPDLKAEEDPAVANDTSTASALEESLFSELDSKADEARKQSEEIDKFFTFNKKNEEFQKLLDQEYEKIKSGNILKEEMDSAAVASEQKFASIKPEDPMEDLFVSSGVVKGYEPKPVETDVLDRIEAAEAEKKAREEAARLIEEEKARAKAEAEEKEKAEAEALAAAQEEEEAARLRLEEEAKRVADARAAQEAAEREQARAAARAEAESAMKAAEEKARKAREEAELKLAQQAAMKKEAEERAKAKAEAEAAAAAEAARKAEAAKAAEEARIAAEKEAADPFNHISEMARARQTYFGQQDPEIPTVDDIKEAEVAVESTKAVDKAAILAGMATASKIVQQDKQAAVEEEPIEPIEAVQIPELEQEQEMIDLPDFLGHLEEEEVQEPEVQTIDQLEDLLVDESVPKTAEELDEIPAELFSVEDLIADEAVPQQTETSTETLIMNEESVADILNNQSEADESIVFPEDFNTAEDINESISTNKIQEPSPFTVFDDEEDDDEEDEKSGKGRIVLKVCLVILIILLAMEITGVVIKIAAPNSGAAKFIDTQLNKVIHVFTGDDTQYSAFAADEDIRTTPMDDKTSLIKEQMGKNKDGNIEEIKYNADLKFDPDKKYKDTDLLLTQNLADVTWYKDAENKQVYYDEAIVGTMIAYNSQKVNLINNNDTSVLNLMQKGTDLYKEVKKLGDKGRTESFKTLEIGEIRQAGSSFYVWISEKVKDSKNGTTTTKKIYELQPEDQTMKVVASYDI